MDADLPQWTQHNTPALGPQREGNWDAALDEFGGRQPSGGGSSTRPFQILDASAAGIEKISIYPGVIEVLDGAWSTFITPTVGGAPMTDSPAPTLNVTGSSRVVFFEVTVNGAGVPTAVAIKIASALPADTGTLKHRQLGIVTQGTDEVTVDEQTVTGDQRYLPAGLAPFTPYDASEGATLKVAFWPGFVNGQAPVIGSTSILDDPPPYLVVTASTSFYLKATVNATDDVTAYEIIQSTSAPVSSYTPGTGGLSYVRLGSVTLSAGRISGTPQHFVRGNLLFGVGDGYLWTSTP